MNPLFAGKIENGKLELDDLAGFKKYLLGFGNKKIQIIVRKYKTSRTLPQNRLYWAYLTIIGQELGYETEELHSTFKAMFLTDRSKKLPIVRSTTGLTTTGFSNYIEKIAREVAEMGIVLPEPEKIDLTDLF